MKTTTEISNTLLRALEKDSQRENSFRNPHPKGSPLYTLEDYKNRFYNPNLIKTINKLEKELVAEQKRRSKENTLRITDFILDNLKLLVVGGI